MREFGNLLLGFATFFFGLTLVGFLIASVFVDEMRLVQGWIYVGRIVPPIYSACVMFWFATRFCKEKRKWTDVKP